MLSAEEEHDPTAPETVDEYHARVAEAKRAQAEGVELTYEPFDVTSLGVR